MEKYMIKSIFALPVTVILLSGCAVSPPQKLQTDDSRVCAQNFTYDGSFLAGRTFKTHQSVDSVSQDIAMRRTAKHLAVEGYSITSTDKELGIISASQTVSFGQGKTVPLNVSFDSTDQGINVSIAFSISGGVTTPVNGVKDEFCDIIKAIQGS
jgi:hypothetical protein